MDFSDILNQSPTLDIVKMSNNLFQGAIPPYGDLLAKKGFEVLVLAATENQASEKYDNMYVINAAGEDVNDEKVLMNYLPIWSDAAMEVAGHVRLGKKCLITCMAGLNRSGFVMALTLHELNGWDGATCVKHIQSRRKYGLCNDAFANWLVTNIKKRSL